jgi:Tol biopolymer transport system component
MPEIGKTILHYRILEMIGVGGMGEVYRAKDQKLGRDVAIKVLPEEFAKDTDRVARFRREAKLLASLNHPNIAAIHGLEESDGTHFLVLELIEGDTLADRIKGGPIPVEESLRLALQIAEALEAAHEKGVIHRDLKPANVIITAEDKVKVLDFGLAKALADETRNIDSSHSPTITEAMTRPGVVLGTAAYMSPEQAKGKSVDKRADIWAFGCILYECLSGKRAVQRETSTETLAAILRDEPDWQALPSTVPPSIRFVLRRCLEKDVSRRFHDAADLRIEIEEALSSSQIARTPIYGRARRRPALPLAFAVLITAVITGIGVWLFKPATPALSSVGRYTITLPTGDTFVAYSLALAPGGNELAYVGRTRAGTQQLFLRAMDSREPKPIPDTEGAGRPFFSPDGQWLGFGTQDGKIKKIHVSGGAAQVLCNTGEWGATWASDGTIYFAPSGHSGLMKVSSSGGTPQEVTKLDLAKGEISHRLPQILPGGEALLFTVWTGPGWDERHLEVVVLKSGERRALLQGGDTGRYIPTGHVVYSHAEALTAVPFDLDRLEITGPPVLLADQTQGVEGGEFSVSDSGTLVYIKGSHQLFERRLVCVDRKGIAEPLSAPARCYGDPVLSPDGHRVALQIMAGTSGIWIYEFARRTLTPFTPLDSAGSSQAPVWTPDGKRIVYRGTRAGFRNLFWKATDGSGHEERLTTSHNLQTPGSFTPDGKWLIFWEDDPVTFRDLWMLPMNGELKPIAFLQTPFAEWVPRFSPDGRWVAYVTNESGRGEICVRPFPGPGGALQISTEGGTEPLWSGDGKELFYRIGNKMMAVDTVTQPSFKAGSPRMLFEGNYRYSDTGGLNYAYSMQDQRFLMIQEVEPQPPATQIQIVTNWFEELRERVPTD